MDERERFEAIRQMVQLGVMSIADARKLLGLDDDTVFEVGAPQIDSPGVVTLTRQPDGSYADRR